MKSFYNNLVYKFKTIHVLGEDPFSDKLKIITEVNKCNLTPNLVEPELPLILV